jgi:hypothetical protein
MTAISELIQKDPACHSDLRPYLQAVARLATYGASAADPRETEAATIILTRDLRRAVDDHSEVNKVPSSANLDALVGVAR